MCVCVRENGSINVSCIFSGRIDISSLYSKHLSRRIIGLQRILSILYNKMENGMGITKKKATNLTQKLFWLFFCWCKKESCNNLSELSIPGQLHFFIFFFFFLFNVNCIIPYHPYIAVGYTEREGNVFIIEFPKRNQPEKKKQNKTSKTKQNTQHTSELTLCWCRGKFL